MTRNIDPNSASDLLQRVPRACLAFAGADGPQAQPVILQWQDGRYWAGLRESAAPLPDSGQEVVLLVDEGVYYFDLRAIYVRGVSQPAGPPPGARPGCTWLEIVPSKTVAWDYGTMREADR